MAKKKQRLAMLINLNRCIGCQSCQMTCKAEYSIPFGFARCRVKTVCSGSFPDLRKTFIPLLCNHCDTAPCIESCAEEALVKNREGIVLFNKDKCSGCLICQDTCPYNAIEINEESGAVEKCDFCYYNRVQHDLLPLCVESCMGKALTFGDINDSSSDIAAAMTGSDLYVRHSENPTNPSIFYIMNENADSSLLTPYKPAKIRPTRRSSHHAPPSVSDNLVRVFTSDAMCPSECGIAVTVENGVAKKIYGNPHSLVNNGAFCAKGAAGLELTYSSERIRTPLIRSGSRGENRWREISWEDAADHIAEKLIAIKKNHGAESVFLDCGDVTDREAYYRLFHAFGTPNTFNHGSICDPNRKWGQKIMLGDERPLPDIQRPVLMRNHEGDMGLNYDHDIKLLLNIGANPLVSTRFNYMSRGIPAAREENGCLYIVIDPSHTNSAALADIWLPINPGSDAALLAAMLHYIMMQDSSDNADTRYIDHEFIDTYTSGWNNFKDAFLSHADQKDPSNDLLYFSLEWAEDRTGISQADIRNISHLFGKTKPAAMEIGMHGTAHHTNGDVTSILMAALCLITGNIDVPGGLVFVDTQKPKKGASASGTDFLKLHTSRVVENKEVEGTVADLHKDLFGDYPAAWKGVISDLPDKIRQGITLKHGPFKHHHYPVKAFITRAGNPVITAGNSDDWIDAVTAKDHNENYLLELLVFIDTHINTTASYADIILPEAGFLERMGTSDVYTMSPELALRDQVIQPLHQAKTPFEIMTCLSGALIKHGDPNIKARDFDTFADEEDFVNNILSEAPGFYNYGTPLPYPDLPEGCAIYGVPDNPTAVWGKTVIRKGESLTVEWLRTHNGVATWPTTYYRYKKSDGSPTGTYPRTESGRFEFNFNYLANINRKFDIDFPTTFYWSECKWNSSAPDYTGLKKEYPFQLISGRAHVAMTMTAVCKSLFETETECMRALHDNILIDDSNISFPDISQKARDGKSEHRKRHALSIPVLAMNRTDGHKGGFESGDTVILENPMGQSVKGRVYLTEEVMPGVIKTAFGPGGQHSPGMKIANSIAGDTININDLMDKDNMSPFTGMPGFGDIMVRVKKYSGS